MRDSRPPAAIVAALGSADPDGAGVVAAAPCNIVRVYELRGRPATESPSARDNKLNSGQSDDRRLRNAQPYMRVSLNDGGLGLRTGQSKSTCGRRIGLLSKFRVSP
jgi:hypothetical protein